MNIYWSKVKKFIYTRKVMAKYSKRLTDVICELIVKDMSISEVCEAVGINRKTFYEWKNSKPEFAQAIEEAREQAYEELLSLARRTLRERIEGYTVEETTYTYEPASYDENEMILKKKVVKRKRKEPNITSLNNMVQRIRNTDKKLTSSTNNSISSKRKKEGFVSPTNSKEALSLAEFFMKIESDAAKAKDVKQDKLCSNLLLFNNLQSKLKQLQRKNLHSNKKQ